MIGSAKKHNGLYYFSRASSPSKLLSFRNFSLSPVSNYDVIL
uniref:Uncharacterized protein n=1 Tax=Rhizophora mucronata TaxID=61149 RepID=A0A2P2QNF5_RHIMU